jgi:hypothetical protein
MIAAVDAKLLENLQPFSKLAPFLRFGLQFSQQPPWGIYAPPDANRQI